MINLVSESDNPFAFSFQWPVATRYELQPEQRRESKTQLPSTSQIFMDFGPRIVRRGSEQSTYPPRAIPDLHRKFVKLRDTPEDVLKFVRDHGFLGVGDAESESVSAILAERNHMRDVLAAFDGLVSLEREAKLTARAWGEDVESRANEFRRIAGGLFNQWATPRFVLRLRPTERGGLALHAEPQSLLGFMWLRVAEELAGGARYTYCMWCQNPILISGKDGARADKKTCSGACRHAMNAHLRKIKAEAESKTAKKSKQGTKGTK